MERNNAITLLLRYKIHHVLLWLSFFVFWREYYQAVDEAKIAVTNTFICTLFSAMAFYASWLWLVPIVLEKHGFLRFITLTLLTAIIIAGLRVVAVFISFKTQLPNNPYPQLSSNIATAVFHIVYAMTVASFARLFIGRYETQKKLDSITNDNLRAELTFLKNQISPHFLFNIHNSIYFLIEENPKLASQALLKLSDIMRYQLYDCQRETVLLNDEIENIQNYVELEKMRIDEIVRVDFVCNVKDDSLEITPFILLTFVENAFKHVSLQATKANEITISISTNENWLTMRVSNTTERRPDMTSNGIGLRNAKRRLELMYPDRHKLKIDTDTYRYETLLKLKL